MMTVKDFQRLTAEIEDAKKQAARAEGVVSAKMAELRSEFGCKTVKEGKRKFEKLLAEAQESNDAAVEALAKFQEKWREVLND